MQKKSNLTKKQHYIPQVYLRGFSPEYISSEMKKIGKEKYTIYVYDMKKQLEKSVPIKSICYENNLYEMVGEKGDVVLPNFLERCFSILEEMFGKYRASLEKKVFQKENYRTKCFLKKKKKCFGRHI